MILSPRWSHVVLRSLLWKYFCYSENTLQSHTINYTKTVYIMDLPCRTFCNAKKPQIAWQRSKGSVAKFVRRIKFRFGDQWKVSWIWGEFRWHSKYHLNLYWTHNFAIHIFLIHKHRLLRQFEMHIGPFFFLSHSYTVKNLNCIFYFLYTEKKTSRKIVGKSLWILTGYLWNARGSYKLLKRL